MNEYEEDRQERTLPYPYTYTFYTVQHFLDNHKFEIRYCNIGRGRILVHYDDRCLLIRGHEGHIDLRFEPDGDGTVLTVKATYYNTLDDEDLIKFREVLLKNVQFWLEREYTMTLPRFDGDIPRFRHMDDGRVLIDGSIELRPPDTFPLVRQLVILGTSMMVGGIFIDLVIDFMPAYWGLNVAILTGLPFLLFAYLVNTDRHDTFTDNYAFFGWISGIVFCTFTLIIGVFIVMFPAVMVDCHAKRIRIWNAYIKELEMYDSNDGRRSGGSYSTYAHKSRVPEVNVVGGMI